LFMRRNLRSSVNCRILTENTSTNFTKIEPSGWGHPAIANSAMARTPENFRPSPRQQGNFSTVEHRLTGRNDLSDDRTNSMFW
jgi:hypothetical protein